MSDGPTMPAETMIGFQPKELSQQEPQQKENVPFEQPPIKTETPQIPQQDEKKREEELLAEIMSQKSQETPPEEIANFAKEAINEKKSSGILTTIWQWLKKFFISITR